MPETGKGDGDMKIRRYISALLSVIFAVGGVAYADKQELYAR